MGKDEQLEQMDLIIQHLTMCLDPECHVRRLLKVIRG